MARVLASNQCAPGSIPAPCHMWVEFVLGPRYAPRVFLKVFISHPFLYERIVLLKSSNGAHVLI